jgi:two-component system CheB/CheR fusion protein
MKVGAKAMSLLVSAGPVVDTDRQTLAAVITLTDVTELKRIEAELKEADARKDEMLAVVVHELRSPLSAIEMAVQLLEEAPHLIADEPLHLRASLRRSVEHITRLVDDLSDFNRIRLHKLTLELSTVDARSVITRAVEDCRALAESRLQRIEVTLGAAPVMVEVDETRLAQVLINLLHNATKFTQIGGLVSVTLARESTQAVISVSDNGSGIARSMLERVFQPFEQLTGSERRGGLGVGLALARRIVELHGGSISAASDGPGKGSAFTVRLPLIG